MIVTGWISSESLDDVGEEEAVRSYRDVHDNIHMVVASGNGEVIGTVDLDYRDARGIDVHLLTKHTVVGRIGVAARIVRWHMILKLLGAGTGDVIEFAVPTFLPPETRFSVRVRIMERNAARPPSSTDAGLDYDVHHISSTPRATAADEDSDEGDLMDAEHQDAEAFVSLQRQLKTAVLNAAGLPRNASDDAMRMALLGDANGDEEERDYVIADQDDDEDEDALPARVAPSRHSPLVIDVWMCAEVTQEALDARSLQVPVLDAIWAMLPFHEGTTGDADTEVHNSGAPTEHQPPPTMPVVSGTGAGLYAYDERGTRVVLDLVPSPTQFEIGAGTSQAIGGMSLMRYLIDERHVRVQDEVSLMLCVPKVGDGNGDGGGEKFNADHAYQLYQDAHIRLGVTRR